MATQSGSCFDPLHNKKELLLVRALIIEFARQEKVVHPRMYKFVIVEWWNSNYFKRNQEKKCRVILKGITASWCVIGFFVVANNAQEFSRQRVLIVQQVVGVV